MEISERELAQFLEATKNQELATWQRQRTTDELGSFVAQRLRELSDADIDWSDMELAA